MDIILQKFCRKARNFSFENIEEWVCTWRLNYNFDCNGRLLVNVFMNWIVFRYKLENHMNKRQTGSKNYEIENHEWQGAEWIVSCSTCVLNLHAHCTVLQLITVENVVEKWVNPIEIFSTGAKDQLEIVICGLQTTGWQFGIDNIWSNCTCRHADALKNLLNFSTVSCFWLFFGFGLHSFQHTLRTSIKSHDLFSYGRFFFS